MTTPDIAGLCERLRTGTGLSEPVGDSGGVIRDAWVHSIMQQAADTIERQAAEIERLRGAAKEGLIYAEADVDARRRQLEEWDDYEPRDDYLAVLIARRDLIRAALTGEDTATFSLSGKTQTDDRTRGDG
jgi:hypothetical protein